ncbi:MAG: divergent PAP2 family protein [Ruminococcaceae bacterium]|nr:divergent PAP2 family protein [Oscillospiraceae bacterium]
MNVFWECVKDFFGNYMLMSAVVAWLSAQIIKIFTGVFQNRKISLRVLLFSTGGMPSSHAAAVVSLATAVGLSQGFGTPMFAVSGVLSVIVMIDASGVRYETGKQATIINRITKELFSGKIDEVNTGLKELVGHTPFQVFMGFLLGIAVAALMFFIM